MAFKGDFSLKLGDQSKNLTKQNFNYLLELISVFAEKIYNGTLFQGAAMEKVLVPTKVSTRGTHNSSILIDGVKYLYIS